jgi:adenylate cyclase
MDHERADNPRRKADQITQWLVSPDRGNESPEDYFAGLCGQLQKAGLPLFFASTSIRTMNPEVAVKNLRWNKKTGMESFLRTHQGVRGMGFEKSPIAAAEREGSPVRCQLEGPRDEIRFPICQELKDDGATDYVLHYFDWRRGHGFMSFATDKAGGFSDEDLALLEAVAPAISVRNQVLSLDWCLVSLLQTYLGRNASDRVIGGNFQRGTGERIRAVIWMSDLRGFTRRVDNEPLDDVIEALDQYFSCLALPVMENGGEVLKFIGDAVLGIFPLDKGWPRGACSMALGAAETAFESMDRLNKERMSKNLSPMDFGLVLHVGEVMYGNIGTTGRLDFTVIGPAVNETSRIESLCKELGHPLLLTSEFAQLAERDDLVGLGQHALRGVSHKVSLYTLPEFDRKQSHHVEG